MQISSYEVGKKYPSAILHQDEIKFDITDGGAIIPKNRKSLLCNMQS